MSTEVVTFQPMTKAQAERVTEQIAYRIDSITDNYEVVMSLMRDALARNVHQALGYPSPGAYISDRFGRSLQTLGAALRREFVHELSDAGISNRAIAPVFGVTEGTVRNDLKAGAQHYAPDQVVVDGITADPETGEVIDISEEEFMDATANLTDEEFDAALDKARQGGDASRRNVVEHTKTEKVKTVTGVDGKTYNIKPKPVPTGDEANRLNAIQSAKSIGRSLEALQYLNYERARTGIVTDWWPLGRHEVPPEQAAYFTPAELRKLAQGLLETADLLEAHHG